MPKGWMKTLTTVAIAAAGCIAALFVLKWSDENDIPFLGDIGDFFS